MAPAVTANGLCISCYHELEPQQSVGQWQWPQQQSVWQGQWPLQMKQLQPQHWPQNICVVCGMKPTWNGKAGETCSHTCKAKMRQMQATQPLWQPQQSPQNMCIAGEVCSQACKAKMQKKQPAKAKAK